MIIYKYIHVIKEDFKLVVVLNRAEKRNAFTPTMINEIHHAFNEANNDDTIKVVIIKANGPIFCAGMDLKTFNDPDLDITNPLIENKDISLGEVFDKLHKPSVALVEGNVIAGGFLIILGCTYVFCNTEVQFRLPELSLGIFPFQVLASLLKVVPEKKALQLCLETDYFDVVKAKNYGIIDGYLCDDYYINDLLNSFKNYNVKALKMGLQSLKDLHNIPSQDKYSYLKSVLEEFRK